MEQNLHILAEDKLSILYFLNCLGFPLTNNQIIRYFIENRNLNYFEIQQYIVELTSASLLNNTITGNTEFLSISIKGEEALTFFEDRISPIIRNSIEVYTKENIKKLKDESQIVADYKKINTNEYEVSCKVIEKDLVLLDLKLNIPNLNQAQLICSKWKHKAPDVFKSVLDHLT